MTGWYTNAGRQDTYYQIKCQEVRPVIPDVATTSGAERDGSPNIRRLKETETFRTDGT